MDREKKIRVIKKAVAIVASTGAGIITSQVIANNTNEETNPARRVATYAGALVIGAIVRDAVALKTDAVIDQIVTAYDKFVTKA
jgi:hypothetical protein